MNAKYARRLLALFIVASIRKGIATKRNEIHGQSKFHVSRLLERNLAEVQSLLFGFCCFSNRTHMLLNAKAVPIYTKRCNQRDESSVGNYKKCLEVFTSKKTQVKSRLQTQPPTCAFALIACCAPTNYHFRYGCFHYLKCVFVFWEVEPCQLAAILPAARQTLEFYQQFESPELPSTSPPSFSVASSGSWNTSAVSNTTTMIANGVTESTTATFPAPTSSASPNTQTPAENETANGTKQENRKI